MPLLGEEGAVQIQFSALAVNRTMPHPVFVEVAEGVFEEIEFHPRGRSELLEYNGPTPILFFSERPRLGPDNQWIRPEPFAYIDAEDLYPKTLLFFWDNSADSNNSNSGFRILTLDDSESAFPFGTFRIVNTCGAPLFGQIGRERRRLSAEITQPFRIRDQLNENRRLRLAFAIAMGRDLELVYSNELEMDQDARTLLILRPPRRPNSIRISVYSISQMSLPNPPDQRNQNNSVASR